jgi:hypothetical protein
MLFLLLIREQILLRRGENDRNQEVSPKDPLKVPIKPITRCETKRIQEELIVLILKF